MLTMRIEIHDYWHIGSGSGQGVSADTHVVRTAAGLPYIPGRALKGLVREAARCAMACKPRISGRLKTLFGTDTPDLKDDESLVARQEQMTRYETEPGALRFGSAHLGRSPEERRTWESWASSLRNAPASNAGDREETTGLIGHLFQRISSTAMEDGIPKHHSLRTIEVVVPLTCYAWVDEMRPAQDWKTDLELLLPLVRALGSGRSRGFGRCTMSLDGES